MMTVGPDDDQMPRDFNDFEVAARGSEAAYRAGKLWGFIRHASISEAQGRSSGNGWRSSWRNSTSCALGETMYGFAVGVYPTDHPTLRTRMD